MRNTKRIASKLIIASISILVFAGCSYTKAPTSMDINNATYSQTKKSTPTAIKTIYSDSLKPLVIAGTITQNQSDMVLIAITQNVSQGTGTINSAGTTNSPGTINGTGKPTGTVPSTNELSALVLRGVITQTQADAIDQKVSEALRNYQVS